MKRSILQVYATIILIVTVITFLITLGGILSAIIDRSAPLHAGRTEISLSSFENFKMDALRASTKDAAYVPDDPTIIKMYEAAKKNKIESVMHQTKNSLIVNSLILFFCLMLFPIHWRLLRSQVSLD